LLLRRVAKATLDLLLSMRCLGCGREGAGICLDCQSALPRLEPPYCRICAQPDEGDPCRRCGESPLGIDGVRSPYRMEGVIREAIHNLKYRYYRALAPELGGLLARCLGDNPIDATVIVPAPLHRRKLRERGYNQSELVAREVGRLTGLRVEPGWLKRTKNSAPQVSVANRGERARNAQGAFEASGDLRGERVLVIDDVCTTGSTLAACSAALKDRGADAVWGLTVAREA